jgi:hypothetical protein
MSPRIEKLKDAIQVMEKCRASHFASIPVMEMFGDKVTWEGVVEGFDLKGHPKTKRAYGWTYKGETEDQFVIVLEIPPVDSAQTAVRAAIASGRVESSEA